MSTTSDVEPVVGAKVHVVNPGPRLWTPLALVLLTVSAWALTLNNGIFIDESVYIRSGRAYIDHWQHGTPLPAWVGEGFSGLPTLYPVLIGALDMLGGLALVRAFSLLCIVLTMLLLRSISSAIFGRRAGLLTAAIFGLTGPVLYVAHLGTFDALVILLLVATWRLGMSPSWNRVFLLAPLLALAVASKYTAYVFVPSLLVLSCFSNYSLVHSMGFREWARPQLPWNRIARALVTGVLTVSLLVLLYLTTNQTTRDALAFTTTARHALSPTPRGHLVGAIPDFIWPTMFAALLGLLWLYKARRLNAVLWGVLLIGTSLLLPVAQIKLGEGVSYQKHMAYSAAFLAPLAGWGFARPWKLAIWTPVVIWWLVLCCVWGAFRAHDLIQYPDVRPVAEATSFPDGTYMSSSADSLSYYTADDPGVKWETTFSLYPQGKEAIQAAVDEHRYKMIILHAGPTGSTIQDEGQALLLDALRDSDYKAEKVGDKGADQWLIFTQ
jgi:4-amino-4-deoxy-L-arabinose transferase-like glycosyltransferase